jgi:hypothetical protein
LLSAISVTYAATAHETAAAGGIVREDLGARTSGESNVPGVAGAPRETWD